MLEALLNFLSVAAIVVRRNSGDDEKIAALVEIIGIAGDLYDAGSLTEIKLQQLANTVQAMVDEDRNPTADELAALRGRSDAAHDRIQDVDLSGGDDPAETGSDDTGESGEPAAENPADAPDPADDPPADTG